MYLVAGSYARYFCIKKEACDGGDDVFAEKINEL